MNKMPTPWNLISKFLVPETDPAVYAKGLKMLATNPNLYGKMLAQQIQEQVASPEAAAFGGIDPMVGVVMPNYRTPQMIQALRKRMSEEMRSRGALGQIEGGVQKILTPEGAYAPIERIAGPDPIDRILRGSWYHGMSEEARKAASKGKLSFEEIEQLRKSGFTYNTVDPWLYPVHKEGFPISHHDALSLSNRLGEPSGVSLTMLPTKAKQFSADEYIHRVHPLYGGPPSGRTVNLMTPEGRRALNDAYDVVANNLLKDYGAGYNIAGRGESTLRQEIANILPRAIEENYSHFGYGQLDDTLRELLNPRLSLRTGPFNLALSQQLQSQGKRGLLYNPRRWDEYEMLMLDPKYVLPLDYRRVGEYLPKGFERSSSGYHNVVATPPIEGATPGVQKGLSQIQDLMSSNVSRLGDIYSERPWTQRLSEENKRRLLELIDPSYREQVGRQLYEGF